MFALVCHELPTLLSSPLGFALLAFLHKAFHLSEFNIICYDGLAL